jgi:putative IMPACT (imprinted ancient) family translation regulator
MLRRLSTSARACRRAALPAKLASAHDNRPPPQLHASETITDRKSRFVGHAAAVSSLGDVAAAVEALLEDKKIARATHPAIYAYRFGGEAGSDDSGEAQAGSRLLAMLEQHKVDNAVVVVTRWYGGSQLGADRFRRINQAGREALEAAGLIWCVHRLSF